jgi:hypothetical protein
LGPPGEASETPARTATAEGHEGESDSPAPTGIEQALVPVATGTSAPAEAVETTAATSQAPTASDPTHIPPFGGPANPPLVPPTLEDATEVPPAKPAQPAQEPEPSQPNGVVAPQGEGQPRLDGKPTTAPHRRTPVQSATGPAPEAPEVLTERKPGTGSESSPAPPASPTVASGAAGPAPVDAAHDSPRPAHPAAHPRAADQEGPGGIAPAATAVVSAAENEGGTAGAATKEPTRVSAAPTQVEQPDTQPSPPVSGSRHVDVAAKASSVQPQPRAQLHELVARVRETIRVTVREERTEARITLHPAELGEVRIRISYGPAGISASIVADSSRAAQTLAQSAPELRRTLEEHGVTLQSVDVQVAGDGAQLGSDSSSSGAAAGSEPETRREARDDTVTTGDEAVEPEPVRDAPLGTHVDVLA